MTRFDAFTFVSARAWFFGDLDKALLCMVVHEVEHRLGGKEVWDRTRISRASGMPRETARRKLSELAREGLLEVARGSVRLTDSGRERLKQSGLVG